MEHRLILGGEQYLPFARSCVAKLKKLGLPYADQSYEVDGVSVKVRIEPGHEYIRIEGGAKGDLYVLVTVNKVNTHTYYTRVVAVSAKDVPLSTALDANPNLLIKSKLVYSGSTGEVNSYTQSGLNSSSFTSVTAMTGKGSALNMRARGKDVYLLMYPRLGSGSLGVSYSEDVRTEVSTDSSPYAFTKNGSPTGAGYMTGYVYVEPPAPAIGSHTYSGFGYTYSHWWDPTGGGAGRLEYGYCFKEGMEIGRYKHTGTYWGELEPGVMVGGKVVDAPNYVAPLFAYSGHSPLTPWGTDPEPRGPEEPEFTEHEVGHLLQGADFIWSGRGFTNRRSVPWYNLPPLNFPSLPYILPLSSKESLVRLPLTAYYMPGSGVLHTGVNMSELEFVTRDTTTGDATLIRRRIDLRRLAALREDPFIYGIVTSNIFGAGMDNWGTQILIDGVACTGRVEICVNTARLFEKRPWFTT